MPDGASTAADRYLAHVAGLLTDLARRERDTIAAAAELLADSVEAGGVIHVFGTGHSHLLAEEMFYRAGGLAAVDPILVDELMLHDDAFGSTELERTAGVGDAVAGSLDVRAVDALVVASNSGGNAACCEVATHVRRAGGGVVAITSRAHARELHDGLSPLEELADVVIDNGGVPGDAAVTVPGLDAPVGPTSTVAGAAIVDALAAAAAERLATRGVTGIVLRSANTPGGDDHNRAALAPYVDRVRALRTRPPSPPSSSPAQR